MNYNIKWILRNTLGRMFPNSKYNAWNYNPTEMQQWWIDLNIEQNPKLKGMTFDEHGHMKRIGDGSP